jgi:hypothetical protein
MRHASRRSAKLRLISDLSGRERPDTERMHRMPRAQFRQERDPLTDLFTFDWGNDQGGIAGISRGNCRLFITNRSFRESYGNTGPILFWLNLDSRADVDELFTQWKAAHANIVSEPEDKPWKLHEFMAADLDGNLIRVFYDFRGET